MERSLVRFKGRFQLWRYTVSHAQLILRSTKSDERATQIDIYFKDVSAINVASVVDDIDLVETEVDPLNLVRDPSFSDRFFLLRSRNYSGFVVAGYVTWAEGDFDYSEKNSLFVDFL